MTVCKRKNGNGSKWIRPARRAKIYVRDGYRCIYCDQDKGILTLDHIVPRSKGGTHRSSNLVTSCIKCNCQRQDKYLKEFVTYKVNELHPEYSMEAIAKVVHARLATIRRLRRRKLR